MEQLTGTDIFVISVLFISGLLSLSRGFVGEMLGIGSWFLATAAGFYAMPYLAPYASNYISNPIFANLASVVAASVIALVVLTIICSKITHLVKRSVLNRLDHFFGLIFGLLRGLIILVLLYFVAMTLAPKKLEEWENDSLTMPYLKLISENVKGQLPSSLFDTPSEEDKSQLDDLIKKLNVMNKVKGKTAKSADKKASASGKPDEKQPAKEENAKSADEVPDIPDDVIVNEGEVLFNLLNAPAVSEKAGKDGEGYEKRERESLDRLIMESIDETGSVVP